MAYTPDPQMVQFWNMEMNDILVPLVNGQYALSEVQQRYNLLNDQIVARYGQKIRVNISDVFPRDIPGENKIIAFGASMKDGEPQIAIFVPGLLLLFEQMLFTGRPDFRNLFGTFVVISFMHELDHLQIGFSGNEDSLEGTINTEKLAWAQTCQQTIRLFAEVYHQEISSLDARYYSAWVECGRNADSQAWKGFITEMYGSLQRVK